MTEAEWLACANPTAMMAFLRGRVGERPLRLFACACCRRVWPLLTDARSREAVEAAESYADARITPVELARAWFGAQEAAAAAGAAYTEARERYFDHVGEAHADEDVDDGPEAGYRAYEAMIAADERWTAATAACAAADDILRAAERAVRGVRAGFTWDLCRLPGPPRDAGMAAEARLLRDVVNPFRPVRVDAAWLCWNDGAVAKMARILYEQRRFAELPLLADALEEAGCADPELLGHCRGGETHVRGCRVLDALMGPTRCGGVS